MIVTTPDPAPTPSAQTGRDKSGTRFLIADDMPLFVVGLRNILPSIMPGCEIIEVDSLDQAEKAILENEGITTAFISASLPDGQQGESIRRLRATSEKLPIIIFSLSARHGEIMAALNAGANGFLSRTSSIEVVRLAVSLVLAGEKFIPGKALDAEEAAEDEVKIGAATSFKLSPRQLAVVHHIVSGSSNKQIARAMKLSEATVKSHISSAMRKLRAHNRVQLVSAALTLGIQEPMVRSDK